MTSDESDPFNPERGRGILTRGDREFLLEKSGVRNHKTRGNTQKRHRIRSRIQNGIIDFVLVSKYLSKQDWELIFEKISKNEDFEQGIVGFLKFLYQGEKYTSYEGIFDDLLTQAVKEVESETHFDQMREDGTEINPTTRVDVSVDLDITVDQVIEPKVAYDKFEIDGDLTADEIAVLIESGKVSQPEEFERLAQLARGEKPEPPGSFEDKREDKK